MKKDVHPEIHDVTAHCTCGFSFETTSTSSEIRATICSACHPFFTGSQKFVDTAGRIEKFEQRYKKAAPTPVAPAATAKKAEATKTTAKKAVAKPKKKKE